jgi:hypothetical protein
MCPKKLPPALCEEACLPVVGQAVQIHPIPQNTQAIIGITSISNSRL